jgi:ferritin-like metal-binding protein YciE
MTTLLSFRDNFIDALDELYEAETQLLRILPVLARNAHNPDLKSVLKNHLGQARSQTAQLERILGELGEPVHEHAPNLPEIMRHSEATEYAEEPTDPVVDDAGLIVAARNIEQHAIAAYGRARTYARLLGLDRANELLHTSLHEVAQSSVQLSDLSRRFRGNLAS